MTDIGTLYGGLSGKSKADFSDGNAPFVTYVNVFNNPSVNTKPDDYVKIAPDERQHRVERGDVLFTGSSENPDECGMSAAVIQDPGGPLYLNSFCFGFRPNDISELAPEFSKYLFRSSIMRRQIGRTANGVTRFNVSKKLFGEIQVPIPPLDEQQRIAEILDRFDALVNDISIGLPAEITTRRKQYEHYRDRLLTFPEAA